METAALAVLVKATLRFAAVARLARVDAAGVGARGREPATLALKFIFVSLHSTSALHSIRIR